jgi:short-subunit dehydrogenase
MKTDKPLALVTGASTGIGYELAKLCAEAGNDVIMCANEPQIHQAVQDLRAMGSTVIPVEANLATTDGVDEMLAAADGRPIDLLFANAATGLGGQFLDQNFAKVRHIIDTNITGTVYLLHKVGRQMRDRRQGRILITGSIAGFIPGPLHATYNASKAFIDSFSYALRHEIQDSGVTVTCLMPGATDTPFFERAGLEDTALHKAASGVDPADVAKAGYDAMLRGDGSVVHGFMNKLQAAAAGVTPQSIMAETHRKAAEPGSGRRD